MQSEALAVENNSTCPSSTNPSGFEDAARMLAAFQAHLNKTGKVCLKPWYWRRFCSLFKPGYEPPWLSTWWETSTREKKELFDKQLEYLALNTDRFQAAYQFLSGLHQENWYFGGRTKTSEFL